MEDEWEFELFIFPETRWKKEPNGCMISTTHFYSKSSDEWES